MFVFLIASCSSVLSATSKARFDGEKLIEVGSGVKQDFVLTGNSLQLKAPAGQSASHLSVPCSIFTEAVWECRLRLKFNPSGSNYARVYVASDSPDLSGSLNGYFVQVGNASDQILLYRQTGTSVRKIAAGAANRLDCDSVTLSLLVERSASGEWSVSSKLNGEKDFHTDLTATDTTHSRCHYLGIFCKYSSTRREAFTFDLISVSGEEFADETAPVVDRILQTDTCIFVHFSERINAEDAVFRLDGLPVAGNWDNSRQKASIQLETQLVRGKLYKLEMENVTDWGGNALEMNTFEILVDEPLKRNDLIINEVLFHPFEGGVDYVELFNRSGKYINLCNLLLASYKSDSIIYAAKPLPNRILAPGEWVVLTSSQEAVCQFYNCLAEENFALIDKLPTYGNTKGCVVLISKDSLLIDELRYQETMHNELQKSKTGVALERLSLESGDWTSASESAGFGTPGYKNSVAATDVTEILLKNDVCQTHLSEEGNVILTYSLRQANYLANISIFNLSGVCVRHVAENQLIGTHGEIIWDGTNDNGVAQPTAPYILLFEAHNPQGDVVRKKFVCVVGWNAAH